MKFGLNIINFGHGASPTSLRSAAQWAEAKGFQLVMLSDHVAVTADVATSYPAPFYEPFTALAWLAGIFPGLELGTTVIILPYRHALLTARMTANLDQLSGGRLIVGVGAGWARAEFEALGVPFERRGKLTDDYIVALKTHWTNDVASVDTPSVVFQDVATLPRPVQQPHPPIWVGGHTPAAIRRTARFGDAWHPLNARLDWLADEGLPLLRELAERYERPVPAFAPRIKVRLSETPLAEADRRPGQGSLDQIRRDVEGLASLGATYVVLDSYHGDPSELNDTAHAQYTLDMIADRVVDAARQTLR